jgi:hypothetical protein
MRDPLIRVHLRRRTVSRNYPSFEAQKRNLSSQRTSIRNDANALPRMRQRDLVNERSVTAAICLSSKRRNFLALKSHEVVVTVGVFPMSA